MTTAIDDLLSVETLTGLIKTFADQDENRACSTLFSRAARQLKPDGESASWDEVAFARHLAPVSHPESPHQRAKRLGKRGEGLKAKAAALGPQLAVMGAEIKALFVAGRYEEASRLLDQVELKIARATQSK